MGTEALPAALLEERLLQQLQLENETLSAVVSIVSSSLELQQVLARLVDLLTRATSCHACFIYLLDDRELRLRAASPTYAHLVGRIRFGVDEGLAGWSIRNRQPAFIRDEALTDPRTNYVAELEEEHFQSMVAVPIPARNEQQPLGVIVLHTVAPREFDETIITVLSRAAALVAGAVENAQLFEDVQLRVQALTRWSDLAQRMAAARDRTELYRLATSGARRLLPCDVSRLYELDADDRLQVVAADPPVEDVLPGAGARVVLDLLSAAPGTGSRLTGLASALGLDEAPGAAVALPVAAGDQQRGVLVVAAREPWGDHVTELVRALGHLLAVALEKADLIERLTEENVTRKLFDALAARDGARARGLARAAGFDLERPHVVVHVRARHPDGIDWETAGPRAERAIRAAVPGTVHDADEDAARFLVAVRDAGPAPSRELAAQLATIAETLDVCIGISDGRRGADGAVQSSAEAADAARLAGVLSATPSALVYRDAGAYRYLARLLDDDAPSDHLHDAVARLMAYDQRRQTTLLDTLEAYLAAGGAYAPTARALNIHVNTLRQRLARAQELSGLSLEDEDLLSVQLVIKLARARGQR